MVKILTEIDVERDELPCSPPTTPSVDVKKRQWEDESKVFRCKMRTLYKFIQDTPSVLHRVKSRMMEKDQSADSEAAV